MGSSSFGALAFGAGLALASAGCTSLTHDHGDEVLYARFRRALRPPPGREHCGRYRLELAQLTPFAWDSVYYFLGETGPITIGHTIGFPWPGPAVPNLYRRLLFVRHRKVVSYIDCPQEDDPAYGETAMEINMFHCQSQNPVLPRSQATFVTSRVARAGANVRYPLIPLACEATFEDLLAADCPVREQKAGTSQHGRAK